VLYDLLKSGIKWVVISNLATKEQPVFQFDFHYHAAPAVVQHEPAPPQPPSPLTGNVCLPPGKPPSK
jgi:hypothetical protein